MKTLRQLQRVIQLDMRGLRLLSLARDRYDVRMMRRWVSIFLLMILPLQFSYAAAAAYCQHETETGAGHFGHHVHQHHDLGASKEPAKGKSSLQLDQDCGVCHSGGLQSVPQQFELTLAQLPASPVSPSRIKVFSSIDISQIERPNWAASL